MQILHYFLGFPPYRTGGLTKFAYDLMREQTIMGHRIMALWPGRMHLLNKHISIKKGKAIEGIESYELVNPLPVPYDEGICEPEAFMQYGEDEVYFSFLNKVRPDIIHIHTMMGIHEAFFVAAKKLGIPTVFTTHDYYGLCNKVYMYTGSNVCNVPEDCARCAGCNNTGLSLKKIMILQSPLYRWLKDSFFVKRLRRSHRSSYYRECGTVTESVVGDDRLIQYRKLRDYYIRLFKSIDYYHFTSSVSEDIYRQCIPDIEGSVINITHNNIKDNRHYKEAAKDVLRLTYLAPTKPYKGFLLIKKALDELWDEGKRDFLLNVYSPVVDPAPYMRVHENGYAYEELEGIMEGTDLLLAPSVWYETFGFTVLEAISNGVPVIVSDRVGAKDIVSDGGIIVDAVSHVVLKDAIASVNREKIAIMNKNIIDGITIKDWGTFNGQIMELYGKLI